MTVTAVADSSSDKTLDAPDTEVNVEETFGLRSKMVVLGFSQTSELVPDLDEDYRFDRDTTLAILAGFTRTRSHLAVPQDTHQRTYSR